MIHNVNIKILVKDILDRYPILEDDRIKLAEIIATAYKKTTTSSITNLEPIKKLIYNEIYGFDIKPEGVIVATNKDLENKVDKNGNKQLSTEDFTTEDKNKLDSLNNYDDTELQNYINKAVDAVQNKIDEIVNNLENTNYVIAVSASDKNFNYPTLNGGIINFITSAEAVNLPNGNLLEYITALNEERLYYQGSNVVTSLSDVPITKRLVVARISTSQELTIRNTIANGKELHIIVINSTTIDITVVLPNTGNYVCLVDTALTIEAGACKEINVISDAHLMYIRSI